MQQEHNKLYRFVQLWIHCMYPYPMYTRYKLYTSSRTFWNWKCLESIFRYFLFYLIWPECQGPWVNSQLQLGSIILGRCTYIFSFLLCLKRLIAGRRNNPLRKQQQKKMQNVNGMEPTACFAPSVYVFFFLYLPGKRLVAGRRSNSLPKQQQENNKM